MPKQPEPGTVRTANTKASKQEREEESALPPGDQITTRIDEALQLYPKKARSSDLVKLQTKFQEMRKQLKELLVAVKVYATTYTQLDQRRLEILAKVTAMAGKTPIGDCVAGNAKGSMATVVKNASQHAQSYNAKFTERIIHYVAEWERIVTTRVDADLAANRKLNDSLTHYTTKVEGLRKRTNKIREAGDNSGSPTSVVPERLQSKLDRNEGKLTAAWKAHERSASALCNLLEEITLQGYFDLHPLLVDLMDWEIRRASKAYDIMATFKVTQEKLGKKLVEERKARLEYLAEQRALTVPELEAGISADASLHESSGSE